MSLRQSRGRGQRTQAEGENSCRKRKKATAAAVRKDRGKACEHLGLPFKIEGIP